MTYSLVADGPSDAILIPILTWCLKQHIADAVVAQWVDFGRIPRQPSMEAKLETALDLYPCDVLFVHRDAERQSPEWRRAEISAALRNAITTHIPVVPVRMTEAWLLIAEAPIRAAAGNPNGNEPLDLPKLLTLEEIADPKKVLYDALLRASGRSSRRQTTFHVRQRVHRICEYIDDFSPLKVLPAFQLLQQDIRSTVLV